MNQSIKIAAMLFVLTMFVLAGSAQDSEKEYHFNGSVLLTNKGISIIPALTLGRPAVVFDLSVGGEKLSFEPQLRFAWDGKPWSFLFWFRYNLIENEKFRMKIGAHPALSFRDLTLEQSDGGAEYITVKRYLAGELTPTYVLSKHISVGAYYLYSYGVEENMTKNHNYLAARVFFSNLMISESVAFSFTPQVYLLSIDDRSGYYFNSGFALSKKDFPFKLSGLINKTIDSDILGSPDFLWNVSLTYSFGKKFRSL